MRIRKNLWRAFVTVILVTGVLIGSVLQPTAQEPSSAAVGQAYACLNEWEARLYLRLREHAGKVADGTETSAEVGMDEALLTSWESDGLQLTWTAEELGVDAITDTSAVSERFWEQISISKVLAALLCDCPYELYWYDKTVGVGSTANMTARGTGNAYTEVTIRSLNFVFSVAEAYRAAAYNANAPATDPVKTAAASASVKQTAEEIVARYADRSDYQKLIGYRDEICALVTYNREAAEQSGSIAYGDPWQLVYVFDGDSATNVVCEGYAKAFQYLCDLTDFAEDVRCYTVGGTMSGGTGAGAHLWNVVVMEDGVSYLADVTNSDSGTIGVGGELFLAGLSGSVASGYSARIGVQTVTFAYDPEEVSLLWGSGADSVLALGDAYYVPAAVFVHRPSPIVYDGTAVTAGRTEADLVYSYGGAQDLSEQYEFSHAWYTDDQGQPGTLCDGAPVAAGNYWIVVTARRGSEEHMGKLSFTVEKATPEYTLPDGLTAVYGQTTADIPLPDGFSWQGTVSVGNVGVNRLPVIFTPDDPNYRTVTDIFVEITVSPSEGESDEGTNDTADPDETTAPDDTTDPDGTAAPNGTTSPDGAHGTETVTSERPTAETSAVSDKPSQAPDDALGCTVVAASPVVCLLLSAAALCIRKRRE